jgi:hypothetical protein
MTEEPTTGRPDPGADPLDELATAIVDGTATADEHAQAGEPALAERVAAHRRIAARLADPPPPPSAGRRDEAIAAALAAVGHGADDGTVSVAGSPVVPLPTRPVPARATGASSRRWLTAAAVVAALAVAIPVLSNIDGAGNDEEQSATAADAGQQGDEESAGTGDSDAPGPLADEGGGAVGATEGAEEGDDSAATTVAPRPGAAVADLGAFAELETLLAAAVTTLGAEGAATGATTTTAPTGAGGTGGDPAALVDRCTRRLAGDEPDAVVDDGATARVADRAVVVLLVVEATGPRLVVLTVDDCDVLAVRPL